MKISAVLLVCLLFNMLSAARILGQQAEISLKPVRDGFIGEYLSGNEKLFIEYRNSNSKRIESRIKNVSGQTVVEAVQIPGAITVKLIDVTLTFYLDQTDPAKSRVSQHSDGDREKLQEFNRSDASVPIRQILASIIRQWSRDGKDRLMGFATIAMVVGDVSAGSSAQLANSSCSPPKLKLASYVMPDPNPTFCRYLTGLKSRRWTIVLVVAGQGAGVVLAVIRLLACSMTYA